PPVTFAITGFHVYLSHLMPSIVLIIVIPSAPPRSTTTAISFTSVTFGDSFTYTGTCDTAFTARVNSSATNASVPNVIPPSLTFGQHISNPNALTLDALEIFLATST